MADRIVNLDQKIAMLCKMANIDTRKLVRDLAHDQGMRPRIVEGWTNQASPVVRSSYRERFINYWKTVHGINFTHAHYTMSLGEFRESIDASTQEVGKFGLMDPGIDQAPGANPEQLRKLVGTYQVLRPHSSNPDRYVLEAVEIKMQNAASTECVMYSANAPNPEYAYRGTGYLANQNFFSIVTRRHEDGHSGGAMRCIAMYVGPGKSNLCVSGIIMRSGIDQSTGPHAVAAPFVAIKMDEKLHVLPPHFKPLDRRGLYQLHKGGHVLVGDVTERRYREIYGECKVIFDELRKLRAGLFSGNDLVLHTVSSHDLMEIESVDPGKWQRLVNDYALAA